MIYSPCQTRDNPIVSRLYSTCCAFLCGCFYLHYALNNMCSSLDKRTITPAFNPQTQLEQNPARAATTAQREATHRIARTPEPIRQFFINATIGARVHAETGLGAQSLHGRLRCGIVRTHKVQSRPYDLSFSCVPRPLKGLVCVWLRTRSMRTNDGDADRPPSHTHE